MSVVTRSSGHPLPRHLIGALHPLRGLTHGHMSSGEDNVPHAESCNFTCTETCVRHEPHEHVARLEERKLHRGSLNLGNAQHRERIIVNFVGIGEVDSVA